MEWDRGAGGGKAVGMRLLVSTFACCSFVCELVRPFAYANGP